MMRLIMKSVLRNTQANLVVTLGDLVHTHTITDEEFARIARRFKHIFVDHHEVLLSNVAAKLRRVTLARNACRFLL
jgi:hypothetical protein